MSWVEVLREMREVLVDKGFDQVPQLTSSRSLNVSEPFQIVPSSFVDEEGSGGGVRRAVLIGINYRGQEGELAGCHNDVKNIRKYLVEREGFREQNITVLMDDGKHKNPSRNNILQAYRRLVKDCQKGDVAFCHYSGHGGRLEDDNGDEDDGYDETLIPVDFQKAGQIRDDDLLKILVHPMAAGVTMTCLMDCCHSGTVLDLPYKFSPPGEDDEDYDEGDDGYRMSMNSNFTDALWTGAGIAVGMAAAGAAMDVVASVVAPPEPVFDPEMMILGGGPNAIHEYSDQDCCVIL